MIQRRNEETVVTVAREELPAIWQQTRATCARGRRAGERIAGYIRAAGGERPQASAAAAGRRGDPARAPSQRRPAPVGGRGGGGRPPAQRTGDGRGSRRPAGASFGVALVGLVLLVGLCSVIRNRAEPSTSPAAVTASPSATLAEPQEAPSRTTLAPSPSSVVSESERSAEEPEQDESAVDTTPEVVTGTPLDGDVRVGELEDAAVAALSVVVAAARSVFEAEGDFGGASVAVLEGVGLAIPAPSELALATGKADVALTFPPSNVGLTTPWEVSVLAPDPGESGAEAVWAAAVRSPVACRAVVFDPDLGSWAGMSTNGDCSGGNARASYVRLRGIGGQRGNFQWTPATPGRVAEEEPLVAQEAAVAPGPPPEPALQPSPPLPDTLPHRPEIALSAPIEGWTPFVGGNASSYGAPDRDDLQWVAWQPGCPSCEAGATLSWVGSYAYPFNRPPVLGVRPKLQSACLHRERTGPLIDWDREITGDRVEALWVDGESQPPGSWWIGGVDRNLMVPEPLPFLEMLHDAEELRVLTADGYDVTFTVAGFLFTPVQANLDHCGHYP